jgi:hypothetical protein
VDTLVKTINSLTHTLRGKKNPKGIAQIEALDQIDKILNNLSKATVTKRKQVTFDETTAPP